MAVGGESGVAIIGVALSDRFEPRTEHPPSEIVYPVVRDALADAGVSMDDLLSIVSCSQDIYDGRTISSMGVNEVLGGYLRSESKVAGDGLLALLYGAARILSGEYDLTVVVAHCMESIGDQHVVENAAFDPYVQRPLGPDETIAAALQADAFYRSSRLGPDDAADVSARASQNAARNPRAFRRTPHSAADVAASPAVCGPLRELEGTPVTDGAVALVLAAPERAGEDAVWLRGIGNTTDTFWTDRDLTDVSALRTANATASEQAGLHAQDCEVVETAARWAHEQLMHLPALGLDAHADVNPSGGQLGGCPKYVVGLARAAEAALRLRDGAANALVHAPSGIANQQHTVAYLSRERG
jgi:acetyl-CoA C-acetyltransferase